MFPATAAEVNSGAQATAPDEAGAAAATAVERVVVTANRTPTEADQVGQSFTVLTLDQIRQDQETSVADIVARTPGVTLARNGGPGQPTSLFNPRRRFGPNSGADRRGEGEQPV